MIKNRLIILQLILVCIVEFYAQDSLMQNRKQDHQFLIHYYPTALIGGDISSGTEYIYKKRFAQELSFQVKMFSAKLTYFDKGAGIDYLFKYNILSNKKVRLSAILGFGYKDIYCRNKQIAYYTVSEPGNSKDLTHILAEDRSFRYFGLGFGLGFCAKLFKRFFVGGDAVFYFTKGKIVTDYKAIVYENSRWFPYPLELPSTPYVREVSNYALVRLKLGYLLEKRSKGRR